MTKHMFSKIYWWVFSGPIFGLSAVLLIAGCAGGEIGIPDFSLGQQPRTGGGETSISGISGGEQTLDIGNIDGQWVGQAEANAIESRCDLNRIGLRFEIDDKRIQGIVFRNGQARQISGRVAADGRLLDGQIGGAFQQDTMEITGRFDSETGQGDWQTRYCQGEWHVDRVSD